MTDNPLLDRLNGDDEAVAPMVVTKGRMFQATVGELLKAIAENPTHPIAKSWGPGYAKMNPKRNQTVDRVCLEALIDNRAIETVTEVINGQRVETKRIGESLDKSAAKPTTKPTEKPAK
jgi:hypothetical protein